MYGKRIILGVTGSIAAYKAADLASKLTQLGAQVYAVLTKNACEFITPLTFRSITATPVLTGLFDEPDTGKIAHVDIPANADLLLITPATANIIGKIAHGIADDWLSTAAMVVTCPVIIAPAMNCNMYANKVVSGNIERLKELGHRFVEPGTGRLACGTEGVGRLADLDKIIDEVLAAIGANNDLAGMNLLVTAGPTREPIDAVRFLSNYSSGKMGYAIAEAAAGRGAKVTLVSGPTELAAPSGVNCVEIQTAKEMLDAVNQNLDGVNTVICAAAVADFSPVVTKEHKIKKNKQPWSLELAPTIDILKNLGADKGKRILIGFAAETEDLVENAIIKVREKNLDFIVANEVFKEETVFGGDMNKVTIITSNGSMQDWPRMSKRELAGKILDLIKENYWEGKI
ncbi:MAG: bifunctional phosphopantothenoylcysteine decarboxylase/phosphopantothenate--cysteine ligase CoaBC [Armatimonadota bacterium]|nr:bifunctional phosphopantothenoylcysteine decarboxylase/phosphopantothenate--cysteine ligase CoaBC [Armatimonadota bacterium]